MQGNPDDRPAAEADEARRFSWNKIVLLAVVAGVIVAGYLMFGDELNLDALARREAQFQQALAEHRLLVFGIAFVAYVVVTGLSLPGAAAMTLVYGWLFKFWGALLLVSFASTAGATLAFLLSRYLLRDTVEDRFGERLVRFNENLKRDGAFYLFTLRLIPAVPFFVINVVMGVTPIATRTFWWVSQVGMLPGTAVYVYAGATAPDLKEIADEGVRSVLSLQLLVAFALLGLFPLVVRWIFGKLRPRVIEE